MSLRWLSAARWGCSLVLLAFVSVGNAGTQTAGGPNEPTAEFCDNDLAATDLEKVRCATKNAIVGAYSWLTPGTREQIDKALKECASGGSCVEADKQIEQLAKSIETIDQALATYQNRASGKKGASTLEETRWMSRLRRAVGEDPTGYADTVKQYRFAKEAKREAVEVSRPDTTLPVLASTSFALGDCISEPAAGLAGSDLILRWRCTCQSERPRTFDVRAILYDNDEQVIRSFFVLGLGYAFRIATPALDGPLAVGTLTSRCSAAGCEQLTEKPRERTRVGIDLRSLLSGSAIARVSAVRLEFSTR